MRGTHKLFIFIATGTLAFSFQSSIAKAEEIPVAGIDVALHNYLQNEENDAQSIVDFLNRYQGISFAKVSDYVNIRSLPSEEGIIVGKLYNNSAATILEKSDDWYKVQSGSVYGYIRSDFLITGEEAVKLAKDIGKKVAHVTTATLKVREEPNTESRTLALVAAGEEFLMQEEKDGWVKIEFKGDVTGFVSADYIEVKYDFEEAVSIEEEQERIAAEQEAEQAEQFRLAMEKVAVRAEQKRLAAASQARTQSQDIEQKASTNSKTSAPFVNNGLEGSSSSSSFRSKLVEYALQFKGNPYVWGGTSLLYGADCSGFTQSIFRYFGIDIPRTSRTQAIGGKIISIDEMKPGDLIFYAKNGTINHVGIYIGNGQIIAASSPKNGIKISNYNYREPVRVVSYIND